MNDVRVRSDCELVLSLLAQSEDAFDELFRRHARSIRAVAGLILGNSTLCEDVVAEVFLALWLAPQAFDPARGSLLGFLRVKAKGKSIDMLRGEMARARRERAEVIAQRTVPVDFDMDMMSVESTLQVMSALGALPPNEREPIELAFQQGMTHRMIASYLGVPEGTIKSRIRSGLRRLREDIDAQRLSWITAHPVTIDGDEVMRL
jgi:RNA polymerase sigma-70 factor (ECF subfamily)